MDTLDYLQQIPFGNTISADSILADLEFFDDWEDRYRYIIDLGKQLPAMPKELQTEDRYVHGCQSQVWLVTQYDSENNQMLLGVDSDAYIVKGLAAIILAVFNRQSPQTIEQSDIEDYFQSLDLFRHISPTRGNGLRSMANRIKQVAAATV